MDRSLLFGALALMLVTVFCGLVAARGKSSAQPGVAPFYWLAALGFPALFWLITLPDAKPFGVGHATGNGVLLGGWAAVLGSFLIFKVMDEARAESRGAALAAHLSLAGAAAVGALLLFKQWRLDALPGVGMGWVAVSAVLFLAVPNRPLAAILAKGAAFGVTLCAGLILAVMRDAWTPGAHTATWSSVMALLGAAVPFVALVSALPAGLAARKVPLPNIFNLPSAQSESGRRGWQLLLSATLLLFLTQMLVNKVADQPALMFCVATGIVAGALCWRLTASENSPNVPPLAALTLLAGFVVSYRLMQGYGAAVMLMGAWLSGVVEGGEGVNEGEGVKNSATETHHPITQSSSHPITLSPPHPTTSLPHHLTTLLLFAAAAMVYRVAATRYRLEINSLEMDEYFAFFGLMVGAALPGFLAQLGAPRGASPLREILRLTVCGALLIAVPLLAVMLWGPKAALVLTGGAALGLLLAPSSSALAGFFALAGALSVCEWLKRALPLYEIARADKARYLAVIVFCAIVLTLLADFSSRRTGAAS